jgi:predicted TPR repeat methyltransferase
MTSFERDYFIDSKVSNFRDYLSKKYDKQVDDLFTQTPLSTKMRVLDFGCGAGGLLRELRVRGCENLCGTDISRWAIKMGKEYGLDDILHYFNMDLLDRPWEFVIFQDVLEHIPTLEELNWVLETIWADAYVYIRVPVSENEGENFVLQVSRNDATHFQCHSKKWWDQFVKDLGYDLVCVINGKAIYESPGVLARVYRRNDK